MTKQNYHIQPSGTLSGNIQVPGDKSISHRAIMLGALAHGQTHVSGFLHSADCLATMAAFQHMGVVFETPTQSELIIHGVGLHGLQAPACAINLGNSGTSIRLLSGILAAQPFNSTLTGDSSLQRRPMGRIVDPLRQMGATITTSANQQPPLAIHGNPSLQAIHYQLPIASAQVKSCLLLAGLYAHGETIIVEPVPSRDHTERMLVAFGCPLTRQANRIHLVGGAMPLQGISIQVPADISSAAFFLVGASIAKGSSILLPQVGINPTRSGIITILQHMGGKLVLHNERSVSGEPIADIEVTSADLHGIEIAPELVPLAIDEFPAIFIAAACAKGKTILRHAKELRVKESDRIRAMALGLKHLGIQATELEDGIIIEGGQIQGGRVDSFGDHRIAMAFAMAGLRASAPILVENCANVATSFPSFVELARNAGLKLEVEDG